MELESISLLMVGGSSTMFPKRSRFYTENITFTRKIVRVKLATAHTAEGTAWANT